ncbi:MAG: UdgX family uracil-DNA binding protein [Proteobacteria bacterium]|nr:UdgX family uracil-DNA binding protein [Pseudomonadota bacterium]
MAATLKSVARQAAACTLCPLYRNATQTVFGEGPSGAALMLVGEQPGDQEDIAGRPFVGPAGKVLDRALAAAGIAREAVYLTNAVKHFKNEPRGKKRLHKRPDRGEVEVCKVWLRQEIGLVRPRLVVALGVTAATALMGRPVVLARTRGRAVDFSDGQRGLVTLHPSAILRMPDDAARREGLAGLVKDLRTAVSLAAQAPAGDGR